MIQKQKKSHICKFKILIFFMVALLKVVFLIDEPQDKNEYYYVKEISI